MKDTNLLCVRHFNSNRFERAKTIPFEWNQFKVHLENKSTNLLEIGIFLIFQKVPCLKRSVVQNTLYQEFLQLLLCLKISLECRKLASTTIATLTKIQQGVHIKKYEIFDILQKCRMTQIVIYYS
ncbi:Hypothetical_protein [Hexamita inflata]|uniref:Hypothetical_protein n=1 Tax=Hexamita inflata TaxID=28002 RepID=A0AA86QMF7_9EUKA|nr:Hypothetical protein HINF_LOCUS46106 [Hexamita inflata]